MIKSMTGFSRYEIEENGIKSTVEMKSFNGRYLELNCRLPKSISQREQEIRDLVKSVLIRGSVSISITIEYVTGTEPFFIDKESASIIYKSLTELKKSLKIKEEVGISHLLQFSSFFTQKDKKTEGDNEWILSKKALKEALKALDKMRSKEGQQIFKDFQGRIKKIATLLDKIETLGLERIPEEREKLRRRVAQLFESDEIDENRIQMEIVMLANKLDISEECVRLRSHIKFFNESLKSKDPIGQKISFLLQEMNREINTIGSKSDDAVISQIVVSVKEELERIREQAQNVE